MPIKIARGDLLASDAHTLVNTVNCVGVMGAGIAKQFKDRYPGMYTRYRILCNRKAITPGSIMIDDGDGRSIINVATKDHWQGPSLESWVSDGIKNLAEHFRDEKIPSAAVPMLGCGHGGLDPGSVFTMMLREFGALDTQVLVYLPRSEKDVQKMREAYKEWLRS